jgi:hypothetical protein
MYFLSRTLVLSVAVGLLAAGCDFVSPSGTQPVPVLPASIMVEGHIRNSAGEGLGGAIVGAYVHRKDECTLQPGPAPQGGDYSNFQGFFQFTATVGAEDDTEGCVVARFQGLLEGVPVDTMVALGNATLYVQTVAAPKLDTLRVQMTLP